MISSPGTMAPLLERALLDCRREVELRALLEVRRWPAFWSVFWRVMSWSVEVVAAIGEVEMAGSWGGGLVEMGMLEVFSGEVWKEEFLRMPGGSA